MTRSRKPNPKPIAVHCTACHRDRHIDKTMCEIVMHPDSEARMSWTCTQCGAQMLAVSRQVVGWLQDFGVPVADWTHIDPWMDRPRDWLPMHVPEVDEYITILRDGERFDANLRAFLGGADQ